MRELVIGGKRIADDTDAFNVAELGHNHGGSLDTCKAMIRAAAQAGADAVKLQKRDNRSLYTRAFYDRPYTSENAFGATYGEHRDALEFEACDYSTLFRDATAASTAFVATAFDKTSAFQLAKCVYDYADERVRQLGVDAIKIASGDLTNTPLLKYVANFGRPMIISTGAASQEDVDRAVNAIWPINQQLAILQCTAVYPAPPALLNLRVITTYRERYPDVTIGLSSHYSGVSDVVAAYVLGARIFEKHFSLDRTAKGTDHAFSLEPAGFAKMVSYLRQTREMLGSGIKDIAEVERPALEKMGKSLVAARDLPAGHVLTAEDIAIKSPGGGFAPYWLDAFVGVALDQSKKADELLGGLAS